MVCGVLVLLPSPPQVAQKLLVQLREYAEKQQAEQDRKDRALWSKAFSKNSEAGAEEVRVLSNVNVNERRLGFSNTTRNPEGLNPEGTLSHNNRKS